jgi:hypothetical protein
MLVTICLHIVANFVNFGTILTNQAFMPEETKPE